MLQILDKSFIGMNLACLIVDENLNFLSGFSRFRTNLTRNLVKLLLAGQDMNVWLHTALFVFVELAKIPSTLLHVFPIVTSHTNVLVDFFRRFLDLC